MTGQGGGAAPGLVGADVGQAQHHQFAPVGRAGIVGDAEAGRPQFAQRDGGAGNNTASFTDATNAVRVSLAITGAQNTGAGHDTLVNIQNLTGSLYNDTLTGDANANVLTGWAGNDTIKGGAANDVLDGGLGHNLLIGGAGADRFVFSAAAGALGSAGPLDPAAFTIGTHATTAAQHVIYDAATGALYYDADGAGGAAQQLVARLTDHPVVDATDILVI